MKTLRWTGLLVAFLALTALNGAAKQSLMQEPGPDRLINGRLGQGGGSSERLFLRRFPLVPAGIITVENIQGNITVEAWDRAEAEVTVEKEALGVDSPGPGIRIDVVSDGKRLDLRTLYPPQSEEPVRVSYRLRVPRQVRLERLRTVVGSIRVRDIEGMVNARTLNGSIEEINITGGASARALNGNIAVSLRSMPEGAAPVQMETVNGNLFLGLPAEANASLALMTVAGRIDSAFALNVSDVAGDSSARTTLGNGGTPVRLRTVRGNIRILQSSEVL